MTMSRSNCNFYSGLQIESMFPFFLSQIFSILRSWSFFLLFSSLLVPSASIIFISLLFFPKCPYSAAYSSLIFCFFVLATSNAYQSLYFSSIHSAWTRSQEWKDWGGCLPPWPWEQWIFLISLKMLAWGYFEAYMKTEQETELNLLHPKFIILNPVHAKPMVFSEVPQVFSF